MKEKYIIFLTDTVVYFYEESLDEHKYLEKNFEKALKDAQSHVNVHSNTQLTLLIDRSTKELQEEKLPRLLLWDYVRFRVHKKNEFKQRKGYTLFHLFKTRGETFFRSLHIPQNDPLYSWISWFNSLKRVRKKTIFIPTEIPKFLKKNLTPPKKYQLITYSVSENEVRHSIYTGPRLLASRTSSDNEAYKSSLHYLSRKFPDIYDSLSMLFLNKNAAEKFEDEKTNVNTKSFLTFMSELKKPSIKFETSTRNKIVYLYIGLLSLLSFGVYFSHQGLDYKRRTENMLKKIEVNSRKLQNLSSSLQKQNRGLLRKGLSAFQWLKRMNKSPLEKLESISSLFQADSRQLQSFVWKNHHSTLSMRFDILLKYQSHENLSNHSKAILSSLKATFPTGKIQILNEPFNSGPSEIYSVYSTDESPPKLRIKVVFPCD